MLINSDVPGAGASWLGKIVTRSLSASVAVTCTRWSPNSGTLVIAAESIVIQGARLVPGTSDEYEDDELKQLDGDEAARELLDDDKAGRELLDDDAEAGRELLDDDNEAGRER